MTNNAEISQKESGETGLLLYFKKIDKDIERYIKDQDITSIAEAINIYQADEAYIVKETTRLADETKCMMMLKSGEKFEVSMPRKDAERIV